MKTRLDDLTDDERRELARKATDAWDDLGMLIERLQEHGVSVKETDRVSKIMHKIEYLRAHLQP